MIALILAAALWTANEIARVHADVDAIFNGAKTLQGAHFGFLAVDSQSGRILYQRNADDAFIPASNFKVLTGSAALAKLGPGFTFKTRVGTLQAPEGTRLVLIGGGDALLRASDLDAAASAVAAAGIGPVTEIDADNSYFDQQRYAPGWTWDDFPFYFSPIVSAMCLEDNVVHATVTPAASLGAMPSVVLQPDVGLATVNRATTGPAKSKDTLDVDRDGPTIVFIGSIPQGVAPEAIDPAVPDPERYAIAVFTKALAAHGVSVAANAQPAVFTHPPPSPYQIVWTHDSAPLTQYLHDFWYPSDNLVGEVLLKSMGVARSGVPGTSANGAALEAEWLRSIGVDPTKMDITDGSGLSIYDRIAPRALVRILQTDWSGPNREIVLSALPVIGFKGTPAERRVVAKTGTRRYARALSGYLRPVRHGTVTFSFLVDDWMGKDDDLQTLRARLLSRFITD